MIGQTALTYADWASRVDKNGKVDKIIEILNQWNEILEDMLVIEANNGTTHKTTVRTGLPAAAWRLLNYGVPKAKSRTAPVTDGAGMLEVYSEVDKALANMSGNRDEFLLSESKAFLEGMSQQMAQTTFYGNTEVNPERFLGFAPRYSTVNVATPSAVNVIDAGGTGSDNTSIWLVCWGDTTVHGIFPKGSKAGFDQNFLGEHTLLDAVGNQYQGYRTHFKWDLGLTVRDWRYVVRIANIDVSDLKSSTTAMKALIDKMIDAEEVLPSLNIGRAAWYGNATVRAGLRRGVLEKISNNLTDETVAGKRVTSFNGVPFRRVDQILNTEARVV